MKNRTKLFYNIEILEVKGLSSQKHFIKNGSGGDVWM